MRNSSILKWAHNNKTSKLIANGKTKDEKGGSNNKNWIHSPDALLKGHVVYLVKFLGNTEVDKPKGIDVVKHGIQKLKFSQQLKKSEGSKTPKVELTISVDGVAIQDPKSKEILHQYPLHKISYCADDKAEKRFFSFIAKEGESETHTCFVFVSDKLAEEITLTIGQAFELAYKKFLDTSGKDLEMKKQLLILQKRIGILENENVELKKRLRDIADIKGQTDVNEYLRNNGIKDLCSVREFKEDGDTTTTSGMNSMTGGSSTTNLPETEDSDEELICLEANNVNKLDGLSLDDLNDDDFNPRSGGGDDEAGNSSSADDLEDFNPRAVEHHSSPAPSSATKLPTLPPRDPSKINNNNNNNNKYSAFPPPPNFSSPASSTPGGAANNPFMTPSGTKMDPFGMDSFASVGESSSAKKTLDSFQAGLTMGNFSLDELDPLKN